MKTIFKIIFSPILIALWLVRITCYILFFPLIILWKILRMITPELTRPMDSLTSGIRGIFRS
jgi:hypothetical protein